MKKLNLIAVTMLVAAGLVVSPLVSANKGYANEDGNSGIALAADNDSASKDKMQNLVVNNNSGVNWRQYNVKQFAFSDEQLARISEELKAGNSITGIRHGESYYNCNYSDGSYFAYNVQSGGYNVSYNTKQAIARQYTFFLENKSGNAYLDDEEISKMFPNEAIEGVSKEKAIEAAKTMAEIVGIKLSGQPYMCVAMDMDNANRLIEEKPERGMDKYGNLSTWSKSDEVYYLVFNQEIDGIPVSVTNSVNHDNGLRSASVVFAVGKNGVVQMSTSYMADAISSEDVNVIDSDAAINVLASDETYKAMDNIDFKTLSLEYIIYRKGVEDTAVIKPVWIYTYEVTGSYEKEGVTYDFVRALTGYIDAVTGQIIRS